MIVQSEEPVLLPIENVGSFLLPIVADASSYELISELLL